MATRIEIVQRIKHDIERGKPVHVEPGILDIVMIRLELCAWLELVRDFFRHLLREINGGTGDEGRGRTRRTRALGFFICSKRKRNWRLRLERSIVSRSMMWMEPKPERRRFLSSSQPMPPAPTRRTRDWEVSQVEEGRGSVPL